MRSLLRRWGVWLFAFSVVLAASAGGRRDPAGDKKREMLKSVRTIAIAPPFFATETLARADETEEPDTADRSDRAKTARGLRRYAAMLRSLQTFARSRAPARLAARTGFAVASADAVAKAMEAEKLTPSGLFLNGGTLKSNKFPTPDPAAIKRLADRLRVDAVLLLTLDEPRRSSQQYFLADPFYGLALEDVRYVTAKGGLFVDMANGEEALHDYIEKLQPRTNRKDRDFLLADWKDAESLLIEDGMDEIARYAPATAPQR